jgi:hypothetical protein
MKSILLQDKLYFGLNRDDAIDEKSTLVYSFFIFLSLIFFVRDRKDDDKRIALCQRNDLEAYMKEKKASLAMI